MRMRVLAVLTFFLAGAAPAALAETYKVDSGRSSVVIHVGKTGLLSAAGHEHDVKAADFSGQVDYDAKAPGRSSLVLTFPSAGLKVIPDNEPAGDAPKVQAAMEGSECLDVKAHPTIAFRSSRVSGNGGTLTLTGDLELHGAKKPLTFPVTVAVESGTLTAKGQVTFKQSDFGIKPISAGGGTVKVKDELVMTFTIVAAASSPK